MCSFRVAHEELWRQFVSGAACRHVLRVHFEVSAKLRPRLRISLQVRETFKGDSLVPPIRSTAQRPRCSRIDVCVVRTQTLLISFGDSVASCLSPRLAPSPGPVRASYRSKSLIDRTLNQVGCFPLTNPHTHTDMDPFTLGLRLCVNPVPPVTVYHPQKRLKVLGNDQKCFG